MRPCQYARRGKNKTVIALAYDDDERRPYENGPLAVVLSGFDDTREFLPVEWAIPSDSRNYTGTYHTYCTRIFVLVDLVIVYDNWRRLAFGPLTITGGCLVDPNVLGNQRVGFRCEESDACPELNLPLFLLC